MELLKKEKFNRLVEGKEVELYTLCNNKGCVAQFSNYGGRWLAMWVPDSHGNMGDVILGFDTLDGYLNATEQYYGAIVGRVCGRIGKGIFKLNNVPYQLAKNDGFCNLKKNHLHGGTHGFSFQVWDGKTGKCESGEDTLEFTYFSRDGEEGYPSNLQVKVTYTFTNENEIKIDYSESISAIKNCIC